jgi:hypothetical protein
MKQHQYLRSAIFKITFLALAIICFRQICAQQQVTVRAKILNPLIDTIAAQHQDSAPNLYFRRDLQACIKHLTNLDQEKARYNRRARFAQDKNLRDFFRDCPVHLLAHVFNYHMQNGDISEAAALKLYGLYTNPAFLAYIATLPGYNKHIGDLHGQAHHCQVCRKRVAKEMRFNNADAVMRFLDDAQQRICFAQGEQGRRAQAAQQQVALPQQLSQHSSAKNKQLGTQKPVSKKYKLRRATNDLIEKYGIPASELTELEGNQQQHALHARFITIMNSAADLDSALKSETRASKNSKQSNKKHTKQNLSQQSYRSAHKKRIAEQNKLFTRQGNYKISSGFVHSCTALVVKSADIGIQSNKKGNTLYASKIADFCSVVLDCAQDVLFDVALGVGEGVCQGVKNVGNMVAHPVDAAINMAHGVHTIVSCAFSTIIVAGKGEITFDFDPVRNLVVKKASQATVRGVTRGAAEIVTETILTGKLCGVIAEFIESTQIISRTARGAARAFKALNKEKPLYVTPEGIEVYLADGASGAGKAGKHSVAKRANVLKSEMDSASSAQMSVQPGPTKAASSGSSCKISLDSQAFWLSKEECHSLIMQKEAEILAHIQEPLKKLTESGNKIKAVTDVAFDIEHIFSKDHIRSNLLKIDGVSKSAVDAAKNISVDIVKILQEIDGRNLLREGPNTIRTAIRGAPIEIRLFIENNTLRNVDAFAGYSARSLKNVIYM